MNSIRDFCPEGRTVFYVHTIQVRIWVFRNVKNVIQK
jgi:hypothetical protein